MLDCFPLTLLQLSSKSRTIHETKFWLLCHLCTNRPHAGEVPGAEKSLARPWKETSYSDQNLQHYTKTYGLQITGIYSCCLYAVTWYSVVSLGRCGLFPYRVGLRTYQHTCTARLLLVRNHSNIGVVLYMNYVVAQLIQALRYKPEGRGFDFRWCNWTFSLT